MGDKRGYSRVRTDIEALLFLDNNENHGEVTGKVINVSEQGFCIHIDEADLPDHKFSVGDSVFFEFMDTIDFYGLTKDYIFVKDAVIRHVDACKNGLNIGCHLYDKEFSSYGSKKVTIQFMEAINGLQRNRMAYA